MVQITRRATLGAMAGAALAPSTSVLAQAPLTGRDVFAQIKKASGQAWDPNAADDRIIYGDPSVRVTGIATCFFSSLDVLRAAKAAGLNYIIPHEASFYERSDDFAESVLADTDPVMTAKKRFVRENNMVIQRMHGHSHSMAGDPITAGLLQKLDWARYGVQGQRGVVRIPGASALEVGRHIKQALGRRTLRMFGDPNQRISTLSVSLGMPGENAQIAQMETAGVDAVVMGEVREPEVLGYAQDRSASRPIVVFLSGHTGEDFGMRLVSDWVQGVFPGLPCRWLPTVDPYTNPA